MQYAMQALARTDNGYALFHVTGHGIALLVMFPAAFCAGMTLPLITYALLRRGYGEKSMGAVYAANTLGAIAGVVLAAHVGLPVFGLKTTVVVGATIDVGLGLILLWTVLGATRAFAGSVALVVAALAAFSTVELDAYRMISGVFRYGRLYTPEDAKLLFYRDGRTASVSLVDFSDGRSIRTNGKSDGGVNMNGPPLSDETTMTLTAVIPLAVKPEAKRVAVIGIGTGITTHTLLGNFEARDRGHDRDRVRDGAGFPRLHSPQHRRLRGPAEPHTHRRRQDPFLDAQPALRRDHLGALQPMGERRFQPFHGRVLPHGAPPPGARRRARPMGAALRNGNGDHRFGNRRPLAGLSRLRHLRPNDKDILIVAGEPATLARPLADVFGMPAVAKELQTVSLQTMGDLDMRRLGGRQALEPLFASYGRPPNSDYYPYVDLNAPRLRFLRSEASELVELNSVHAPIVALFDNAPPARPASGSGGPEFQKGEETRRARHALEFLLSESRRSRSTYRTHCRRTSSWSRCGS
jgi:hypothetical protein